MLWLWLVSGLVEGCLCSGIYSPEAPAPFISTSEAHGPLARMALHASRGNFPYYTHQGVPSYSALVRLAPPPSPTASSSDVNHRLSTIQPAEAESKHTTAKFQVKRPAIQKQFYEIEERTVVRPIGTVVVELGEPIPKNYAPSLAVAPAGHPVLSQYHPAYSYLPGSYPPLSYYYPFQVPVQAYPPSFIQGPQGVIQIPQQTPVYPQQPILAPRPPHQYPAYPQQPVYGPKPPQLTPTYPQSPENPSIEPPQPSPVPQPPSSSTGEEEFDYSDTVVIDNPDLESFVTRKGRPVTTTETLSRRVQAGESPCDEEERRILEEFQNRQILRLFNTKQSELLRGVQPSQIQTLQELEELGRQLKPEDGAEEANHKLPAIEKSSTTAHQGLPFTLRSTTGDHKIINPKLITPQSAEGQTAAGRKGPGEGRTNQQRLVALLSDDEEASGAYGGRLVSVTPVPDGEGLAERVSSRGVVVSRPVHTLEPVPTLSRLARPTLAAAVIFHR